MCEQPVLRAQCPVVLLPHLTLDAYARRHSKLRPSDVYGEAARARWKRSRRPLPLARSAAAIRAARAARSAFSSTSALSSSALSTSDNLSTREATTDDSVTNVLMSNGDANGDVTFSEDASQVINVVLPIRKFYNKRVVLEPTTPMTSSSAEASVEIHRSQSDANHVPHSPSKHTSRKRKSPQQQAANRVKKTYDKTSNRTDKLNGQNTSFNRANRSAFSSPSRKVLHTDAVSLAETSLSTDKLKHNVAETHVDDDVRCCDDDTLPVVPIDENYASMSIAALDVMTDSDPLPKPDSDEPLANNQIGLTTTSPAAVLASPNSDVTLTRNLASKQRVQQTIFERFINALSLHKQRTSQKDDSVLTTTRQAADGNAVPSAVQDAKNEVTTLQRSTAETDNNELETSNEQLPEILVKNDETIDNSATISCSPNVANNTERYNSTSVGAQTNTAEEIHADTVVNADGTAKKHENSDAKEKKACRRQSEKKARVIKAAATRRREDTELLVTSRPVRKRQSTVFMDAFFDNYTTSVRKATLPAKFHGSCLLPPDFDASLSKSSGALRQSWKTVLEKPDKTFTRFGPGRPRKTKRQNKRRKGTVIQDEVRWTIHKKLLLGGPMSKTPKSASRSTFARKRKLKSPPKSSSVDFSEGKLWTRSMARIQGTAAKQINTISDDLTISAVGASQAQDEVRDVGSVVALTSSESSLATFSTDEAALSLNQSSSEAPAAVTATTTMPDSPFKDKREETALCDDTPVISATTTTAVEKCVEPEDEKADTVNTASALSPHDDSVQQQEAEPEPETKPELAAADVPSVDEASVSIDQSATQTNGSGGTLSTTATNTDDSKVDEESVEALMHLVKQLHDAVANEKLRKAKGAFYLFHQSVFDIGLQTLHVCFYRHQPLLLALKIFSFLALKHVYNMCTKQASGSS